MGVRQGVVRVVRGCSDPVHSKPRHSIHVPKIARVWFGRAGETKNFGASGLRVRLPCGLRAPGLNSCPFSDDVAFESNGSLVKRKTRNGKY